MHVKKLSHTHSIAKYTHQWMYMKVRLAQRTLINNAQQMGKDIYSHAILVHILE